MTAPTLAVRGMLHHPLFRITFLVIHLLTFHVTLFLVFVEGIYYL